MHPWTYRDRWGLVTGASAGFGAEFARALAARGMHLVLTARREDRLRVLAGELRDEYGVETEVIAADLSEADAPLDLWEKASAGRQIHLLVNNAGFGAQGRFTELARARQSAMVRVNVSAPLELMHLALPDMRRRGDGGVVNVSSIAAFQPVPYLATYAATKAFVQSLSEAVWAENRALGVRVLALAPGRSPTEFQNVAGTEGGGPPTGPGVLSAERVVRHGLKALERGRPVVVPGAANVLGTLLPRIIPRMPFVRIVERVMGRRQPK